MMIIILTCNETREIFLAIFRVGKPVVVAESQDAEIFLTNFILQNFKKAKSKRLLFTNISQL